MRPALTLQTEIRRAHKGEGFGIFTSIMRIDCLSPGLAVFGDLRGEPTSLLNT